MIGHMTGPPARMISHMARHDTVRPLPLPARLALLILPLATAWLDYFENEGIAAMLAADQRASDELIERTSFWTRAKSLAGLATELVCVMLAAIAFVRWRHRRQSQPR